MLMRDLPPLLVTVDWGARVATVAVHGELDTATCSQLLERLTWVIESRPRLLVLDLVGVADRFGEQAVAVIAAARERVPAGCQLEVHSASPDVRSTLQAAGWSGVRISAGP
jgi:anti-anti-sigma regulatory factor